MKQGRDCGPNEVGELCQPARIGVLFRIDSGDRLLPESVSRREPPERRVRGHHNVAAAVAEPATELGVEPTEVANRRA